jgi:formylglycine-generating enzyme required for sulfatase activity
MIPIPAGTYTLGSPDSEEGHTGDEGPQVKVSVEPFWIGKTEVTWAEYKKFMSSYQIFKDLKSAKVRVVNSKNRIDAVTVPTPLYEPDHTFEFGEEPNQPAVTMTQYAAKQYTKWLSGLVGQQFRLPSEAEWEYACRAGTTSAYSFGDSADSLKDYAVFADANEGRAAPVGSRKPNAWGLHDMHGNVWEWTIDAYTEDGFAALGAEKKGLDAIQWPTSVYPRCVRGGGWQDSADRLRAAARMGSDDEEWKSEDPNIPHSPWWYTSDPAREVGFRLVRSAKPLDKEWISKFWEIDNEDLQLDVDVRIDEGRGVYGLPVPELEADLKKRN